MRCMCLFIYFYLWCQACLCRCFNHDICKKFFSKHYEASLKLLWEKCTTWISSFTNKLYTKYKKFSNLIINNVKNHLKITDTLIKHYVQHKLQKQKSTVPYLQITPRYQTPKALWDWCSVTHKWHCNTSIEFAFWNIKSVLLIYINKQINITMITVTVMQFSEILPS